MVRDWESEGQRGNGIWEYLFVWEFLPYHCWKPHCPSLLLLPRNFSGKLVVQVRLRHDTFAPPPQRWNNGWRRGRENGEFRSHLEFSGNVTIHFTLNFVLQ